MAVFAFLWAAMMRQPRTLHGLLNAYAQAVACLHGVLTGERLGVLLRMGQVAP